MAGPQGSAGEVTQARGPHARQQPWNTLWQLVFVAISVGGVVAIFLRMGFELWFLVLFLPWLCFELYGIKDETDAFPPLTQIIREYSPRWLAFLVIYGVAGLAAGTWFHLHGSYRYWLAAFGGFVGWATAHFDVIFDSPKVTWDNEIYQWYANKLHLNAWSQMLRRNQAAREAKIAARAPNGTPFS